MSFRSGWHEACRHGWDGRLKQASCIEAAHLRVTFLRLTAPRALFTRSLLFGLSVSALFSRPSLFWPPSAAPLPPRPVSFSVQGNVTWSLIDNSTLQAAKLNDTLCVGDTVRVGAKSRAVLRLPNETTIPLDQNTIFQQKQAISEIELLVY